MASAPRFGPTVLSSITVRGAGREPARSRAARVEASLGSKFPVICPCPLGMTLLMVGAVKTLLSRTMAKGRLMFCRVMSANIFAPAESSVNEIIERPGICGSKPARASLRTFPSKAI